MKTEIFRFWTWVIKCTEAWNVPPLSLWNFSFWILTLLLSGNVFILFWGTNLYSECYDCIVLNQHNRSGCKWNKFRLPAYYSEGTIKVSSRKSQSFPQVATYLVNSCLYKNGKDSQIFLHPSYNFPKFNIIQSFTQQCKGIPYASVMLFIHSVIICKINEWKKKTYPKCPIDSHYLSKAKLGLLVFVTMHTVLSEFSFRNIFNFPIVITSL